MFEKLPGLRFSWLAVFMTTGLLSLVKAEVADTKVLKWRDGKQAAFLISFDDSCASHLTNVIPELQRRGIVGNFYINPGKGAYPGKKAEWEKAAQSPVVAIANHTFTHAGATDAAQLDDELEKGNAAIKALLPERKWPRLIGFGKPGGVPWNVSDEEVAQLLAKHHLVDRPPFWGPPIHQKSAAECVATIHQALAKGELGHLDFHGVGGDWLVTPLEWFTVILDKLDAEKDRLWITDIVSVSQYQTELKTAEIKVLQSTPKDIRLTLTSAADPVFYDLPLTLETSVPGNWKSCIVKQGSAETTIAVTNGVVRYAAIPGKDEIQLVAKP